MLASLIFAFTLTTLISPFLRVAAIDFLDAGAESDNILGDETRKSISFRLGHEYTLQEDFDLQDAQSLFHITSPNLPPESYHLDLPPTPILTLRAHPTTIHRPRNPQAYEQARLRSLHLSENEVVEWDQVKVAAPDMEDKHTVGQLARMTGNAYALSPRQRTWYEVDGDWNTSFPFGWEDAADGFRGHVFLSPSNSTVILSIKGTTLQGPTSKKDKFNDNLLFSCCCARVDLSWVFSTVCGCYSKKWRCDDRCLSEALVQDSLFYNVGVNLINNLTALYPTSTIWLVGHSLGGALASLLGTTFGLPAIAFESPGERLAAQRLHLPLPPPTSSHSSYSSAPVTHIYHNADPIPQGACTGLNSPCTSAGFALETRCHLGRSIVYDTVEKLGWKVDVRKHVIRDVILKVVEAEIEGGWDVGEGGGEREVPEAVYEDDCVDCYKWEFGDFKDREFDDVLSL